MFRRIADLLRATAVFTLIVVIASLAAWGQGAVTSGTITGDVTDSSGAVLPGAKVVAHHQGIGLKRETVADGNGHFVLSQVPAGHYNISVTAPGFKEAVMRDFQLNVDAVVNLKFALNLGSVEQNVDVSAEGAQVAIELSKSEISNVIQEIQVRQLPINQRSFTALVTQQPGLVTMTNSTNQANQSPVTIALGAQGSMISANGMISQSMAYLVDGVNINNSGFGAPGTAAGGDVPGVEGIQEFKVLSQNYSAAYGGSAGAVVSFATRSGTNNFHGSAYEFFRNDVLDAREFFNRYPDKKAPYRRNQFGATFGGPIRKDKTFFFTNYEALRSRLTTTSVGTVPSMAARNGGLDGTSGFEIRDPWGNLTSIRPDVKALLSLYPQPNGLDFGNGIAQLTFPNYQPVNQHYGLVRVDQILSSKDTLMARYSITDARGFSAYNLPVWRFDKESRLQGLVLKWTRTISNNLVNTLSVAGQRSLTIANTGPAEGVNVPPAAYTGNAARSLVGAITVGSGGTAAGSLSVLGSDAFSPLRIGRNSIPVNEDLMYIRGAHTFKFGGQFTPLQWNYDVGLLPGGIFIFNNLNDLLAGYPAILFIRGDDANPHLKYRSKAFAWYVEDAWRVKSNLTVTLGLRHEFQAPFLTEIHEPKRMGNFPDRSFTLVAGDDAYNNFTKKQFSPRIGIAWDPFNNGKTVVRTGFGMFYDQVSFEAISNNVFYNFPEPAFRGMFGVTLAPPAYRGTPDNPSMPIIPFPSCPPLPDGRSTCTGGNYIGQIENIFLPMRPPTTFQWNLQVERELPGALKVSATYTGAKSYNIMRGLEGNSSKPCGKDSRGRNYYGPTVGACGYMAPAIMDRAFALFAVQFDGKANYNAGTLSVSRRFGSGVSFSTSYTFAKAMSNTDVYNSGTMAIGNTGHSADPLDPSVDWSESMWSIRHRYTMNGMFELPFGRGKKFAGDATGLKQVLLGGWSINPLMEIRSGNPFSVLTGAGVAISNINDGVSQPDRPNMIRANAVLGGWERYFDPKAYYLQEPGYLGDSPRNSVRGPGFTEVDLSLTKQFKTSERTNLEFRAEAFNIINHPNFDLPFNQIYVPKSPSDTDQTSCNLTEAQKQIYACNPQAGRISRSVGTPRQLQFALKFTF